MLGVQINRVGEDFAVTVLFPAKGFIFKRELTDAHITQILTQNALNFLSKSMQASAATDEQLVTELNAMKELRPVLKCEVEREGAASQTAIDAVIEGIAAKAKKKK
jgi:hypothetical protein